MGSSGSLQPFHSAGRPAAPSNGPASLPRPGTAPPGGLKMKLKLGSLSGAAAGGGPAGLSAHGGASAPRPPHAPGGPSALAHHTGGPAGARSHPAGAGPMPPGLASHHSISMPSFGVAKAAAKPSLGGASGLKRPAANSISASTAGPLGNLSEAQRIALEVAAGVGPGGGGPAGLHSPRMGGPAGLMTQQMTMRSDVLQGIPMHMPQMFVPMDALDHLPSLDGAAATPAPGSAPGSGGPPRGAARLLGRPPAGGRGAGPGALRPGTKLPNRLPATGGSGGATGAKPPLPRAAVLPEPAGADGGIGSMPRAGPAANGPAGQAPGSTPAAGTAPKPVVMLKLKLKVGLGFPRPPGAAPLGGLPRPPGLGAPIPRPAAPGIDAAAGGVEGRVGSSLLPPAGGSALGRPPMGAGLVGGRGRGRGRGPGGGLLVSGRGGPMVGGRGPGRGRGRGRSAAAAAMEYDGEDDDDDGDAPRGVAGVPIQPSDVRGYMLRLLDQIQKQDKDNVFAHPVTDEMVSA